MRKIRNPYAETGKTDNQCFGCSPNNPIGLHLEFWEKGEEVIAKWIPRKSLQGFRDVLHGGIQATLLDELASVASRSKFLAVLANQQITAAFLMTRYSMLVNVITPATVERFVMTDPDDDHVIACALMANADMIVTGDTALLAMHPFRDIAIVSASDAMKILRGE